MEPALMAYSEGAKPRKFLSAASTNATSVTARATKLHGILVINTTPTLYYLKFYDKASAPTVGTDVPVLTVPIPASATGAGIAAADVGGADGAQFYLGLAFALTAGIADSDTANAATGVAINLFTR
jgi:hypothetical protein